MKDWFAKYKWYIAVSMALMLVPMLMGVLLWDQLPDTMITHWGADGVADGSSGKAFAVFGVNGILIALNLLAIVATAADKKNHSQSVKAMSVVFWIIPMMSMAVNGLLYGIALEREISFAVMPLILGVTFVLLGNQMPRYSQNSTMGVKLPWTLANEENWNKTHRFAGKIWVGCGFAMLLSCLLPVGWMMVAMFAVILISIVPVLLYSYGIYRKHKAAGIEYFTQPKSKKEKMARIFFWVLMVLILGAVLVIMFTGDISYRFEADGLHLDATYGDAAVVYYDRVDNVQLREDLDFGSRIAGVGSARLSLGTFENEEFGKYTLYAYTGSDMAVVVRSGEKVLVVACKTQQETRQLFEQLQLRIG